MQILRKRRKRWPKFVIFAIVFLILLLLNGCTKNINGNFCDIYLPVFPDYEKDTAETIRQIDRNNVVHSFFCIK